LQLLTRPHGPTSTHERLDPPLLVAHVAHSVEPKQTSSQQLSHHDPPGGQVACGETSSPSALAASGEIGKGLESSFTTSSLAVSVNAAVSGSPNDSSPATEHAAIERRHEIESRETGCKDRMSTSNRAE
jgi:hypothetical protein